MRGCGPGPENTHSPLIAVPAPKVCGHDAWAVAGDGPDWRIIQPIRVALQVSLVLLLLEIAAWLLSIGGI